MVNVSFILRWYTTQYNMQKCGGMDGSWDARKITKLVNTAAMQMVLLNTLN